MPNLLKQLELGELSLVDNPANPLAKAPLYKRDSQGDNMEDTIKMSDKMKDRMKYFMEEKGMSKEDAQKAVASEMEKAFDLAEENERLRKGLIDNGFVIKADTIEKKAEEEMIEVEGESVAKSAIPAPVLKALEAAEVAKRDAEVTKKAQETLPNFDTEVAKTLMGLELDGKVVEALMAADAAFEAVMTEKGETAQESQMQDPSDAMNELAKSYQKKEGVSFAKAYAVISKTDEGKALLKEIYKKED